MGYTPEGLANYMTLLGWSPVEGMDEIFTLQEAAKEFGFERVNKAGAKFDWDKLNWINSQYLHKLPADQLTDLLIPYWQTAGFESDWTQERSWLEQLAALIGPSLTRLEEAVEMSRYLFVADVGFTEEATKKLHQEGAATIMQAILEAVDQEQSLTEASAQDLLKRVAAQLNQKEGKLKPILRVALTGIRVDLI